MTHTHYKWPCSESNGRHEWFINWKDIHIKMQFIEDRIGIPVKCGYDCGAFATEYYKFDEIIEGE